MDTHVPWTAEEVVQLHLMRSQGFGYNTIAERLGRSEHGIRQKLELIARREVHP